MIIGIDASNIRAGGGLTHLTEILNHANPQRFGISRIVVWSNEKTLDNLPDLSWLKKISHPWMNNNFVISFLYQALLLSKSAKKEDCNLLFVPGGTFLGMFKPIVSMSQNMLPFENEEINRFSDYKDRIKFKLLRKTQSTTFKKSKGMIFLTKYASNRITNLIGLKTQCRIIPHGIDPKFLTEPKKQEEITQYSTSRPFKFLYVSTVTAYKHQWNVVEAVLKLRQNGYPVTLELVGGASGNFLKKLNRAIENDISRSIVYRGLIDHKDLAKIYRNADGFVFASSCENMPIILIEAMTSGLPIASSDFGPMPEVLGNAGFYFNPLEVESIYTALKTMLDSKNMRADYSHLSYNKSKAFTWKDCSDNTIEYLSLIAKQE